MVDHDTSYRVTGSHIVAVTVVVHLQGAESSGSAVVLGATLDEARTSPHVGLATARAWYALAQQHEDEPAMAYEAAHAGLDALGTQFVPRGLKDDTVFLVSIAEQKRGTKPEEAAQDLAGILYGRLRKYTVRWHSEVE